MKRKRLKEKLKHSKILYVEDDAAVRQQISEFLQRYVNVFDVGSAEEALELYGEIEPDILLLDVNLPGKSGLALAKEIRLKNRDVRMIVSTAYTDTKFLLQAIELELTRYLVKPVVGTDLLEAVEKAVDEHTVRNQSGKERYIVLEKGYRYDMQRKVLMHGQEDVPLRRKEMVLLEYFITHANELVRYEVLEYDIWQEDSMSKDAIRSQIRNLRKKTYPHIVENIPAVGYRLTLKEER